MTYEQRIREAFIRIATDDEAERSLFFVESIFAELQNELYLVDQCLAMVDPSQPEFTGECPICKADVTADSTETHRDDCALAEVIIAQAPHDCFDRD